MFLRRHVVIVFLPNAPILDRKIRKVTVRETLCISGLQDNLSFTLLCNPYVDLTVQFLSIVLFYQKSNVAFLKRFQYMLLS